MNNIKISVIIPIYNRANTLERCLKSVVNQSYPPNEIIVVDDGSTDNSTQIIRQFDKKIKIVKLKKNYGAQKARNEGIRNAKNDWIAFIDSDDEWLETKLEKQINSLVTNNCNQDIVIHSNCYVNNIEQNDRYWGLPLLDGDNVLPQVLLHSAMLFPSILTSKKSLIEINYLDENVLAYQEWDTAISLSHRCKFVHINEPLFIYHQKHGKTISENLRNSFTGYWYIINKHKQDIIKYCGNYVFNRHLLTAAILALNSGDFHSGRKVLKEINQFSIYTQLIKFFAFIHLKPKYLLSIGSYIKGKL